MTAYTVIRCRGIGEPSTGRTMLHNVTDQLPRDHYKPIELPWSAEYGPVPDPAGQSFDDALADGRRMLLSAIRGADNPVILLGYSGGAMLAGNVADEIGRGEHPDIIAKLNAVGLVADPAQPIGQADNGSFGVTGSRDINLILTRWVWDERDPIPCTPTRSPLRTLADQSAAMSIADPYAWGADLIDRLLRAKWQPSAWDWLDLIGTARRYNHAIDQARYYLNGGHVRAYQGAPFNGLARWIRTTTAHQ
ncbi:PE-PPE domain-containing protein [Tomitella fengzijianii]|uniref:PE-PPE domain-containing protein n=1 Tax=Tomitella fengzijianii TaxID=2597660 RepID=A0A516X4F0_9ACTN|nr:PE-PPE domain-containing protein [Tomitella fengzijianii]QDQ97959.1 PE-PPE domain-containing protein [Tomitella fengzijianii]